MLLITFLLVWFRAFIVVLFCVVRVFIWLVCSLFGLGCMVCLDCCGVVRWSDLFAWYCFDCVLLFCCCVYCAVVGCFWAW